ncbi:MAG: hypothetical protein ACTTID_02910 [Bacillales bacterium]
MNIIPLTEKELNSIFVGEAITLATVMAVMVISLVTVIVYRIFTSESSSLKFPGGWQFTWK